MQQTVCSDSIVVSTILQLTVDPEVPGSGPDWVPIFYEARSIAQGLPEPSSLWSSTSVPEQLNMKAVTEASKLINGCSLKLCSATPSVASSGLAHKNTSQLNCMTLSRAQPKKIVTVHYITLNTAIQDTG